MDIPTISYLKASSQHTTARHIKKRYREFYEIVNNIDADSFSEKLYIHFFGRKFCEHCGALVRYKNFNEGYHTYCGLSCRSLHTRNKAKQTCLERYGDSNYNNRDKAKQTSLDKYGVESWNTLPEKIQKTKEACIQRFGVPCSFQSKSVQAKFKQTCLERYGVEWYTESPEMITKSKQTCLERYGVDHPMRSDRFQQKAKQTCIEKYGSPHGPIGHSKKEEALAVWIESNGINIIRNYSTPSITEIDIFIPDLQIGIEFNGIYWHSKKHKSTKYHLNKTQICFQNNIKLYHIWEHWDNLTVYEFILHILNIKPSKKDFDKLFYRDGLIHIDLHPEMCMCDVKMKRRMFESNIYYDSGVLV